MESKTILIITFSLLLLAFLPFSISLGNELKLIRQDYTDFCREATRCSYAEFKGISGENHIICSSEFGQTAVLDKLNRRSGLAYLELFLMLSLALSAASMVFLVVTLVVARK